MRNGIQRESASSLFTEYRFALAAFVPDAWELRSIVLWAVTGEGHDLKQRLRVGIDGAFAIVVVGTVGQLTLDTLNQLHSLQPLWEFNGI